MARTTRENMPEARKLLNDFAYRIADLINAISLASSLIAECEPSILP